MVRKLNPAVIQGWMYHGNLFATLGSFFCFSGKELFWNIRHTPGDLKNEKKNTKTALHIGALLSFLPKGIIYNSYTSSNIHSLLGYRSDKAVIIGNGFDLSFFSPRMKKTDKDFSVALLGRFHPMKNHRMFFNVSKKLCSRYPKMKFLMAGRGVLSGNQWNDEWSGHGLLPEKLKVYDEIEVNSDLFSGIDLLVLCSSWGEAFPNIVGEAMACGVPCVVTDVGDSGRIVEDSGVIVPVNDEDALFAGIESFLASPALYESKSKKARKIIEDKFSLPTIVQKYRQLYKI